MSVQDRRFSIIVLGWALGLGIALAAAFYWIDNPRYHNDQLLLYVTLATAGGGLIAGALTGAADRGLSSRQVIALGLIWGVLIGGDFLLMARLFKGYGVALPLSFSSILVGFIGGALTARLIIPTVSRRQLLIIALGWTLALFGSQWIFLLFSSNILGFLRSLAGEELPWLGAGIVAGAFAGSVGALAMGWRLKQGRAAYIHQSVQNDPPQTGQIV